LHIGSRRFTLLSLLRFVNSRKVERSIRVGKERVRHMMQEHGIKASGMSKFALTIDSKHDLSFAPNLLQHNLTADAPAQV
jgi:putative transposase